MNTKNVEELRKKILDNELSLSPEDLYITGASYIYQTTQFPMTETKYHNYYLLARVESYFGACSHVPSQLEMNIARDLSGIKLSEALSDNRLPVQIAVMDAFMGVAYPHKSQCSYIQAIHGGTPIEKANQRDSFIVKISNIKKGQNVALIGVVNPLVKAINDSGAICLPCDLNLKNTEWGDPVESDMNVVLLKADAVICTAMTLSNGTFDSILEIVRKKNIPLTVYAQTGSAIIAYFVGQGVTNLVAEPFPFTQFSNENTNLYCYTLEEDTYAKSKD